jgi:hypothetical protein
VHRPTVGILSIVLLSGAGACHLLKLGDAIAGPCWRVGLVLAMLWLALPELMRIRQKWLVWLLMAALLLIALRAIKLLPIVAVFLVVYAIIRPRPQGGAARPAMPRDKR